MARGETLVITGATSADQTTALIIAQRLSAVAIADRVLVLRAGLVIEDGFPAELMGGTGEHAELHARWAASLA